jgi:RimJ/RimL family protein N-acetyltransferase
MKNILKSELVTLRRLESSDLVDMKFISGISKFYEDKLTLLDIRDEIWRLSNKFGVGIDKDLFFIIEINKRASGFILLDNYKEFDYSNKFNSIPSEIFSGDLEIYLLKEFRDLGFREDSMKLFLDYCFNNNLIYQVISFVDKKNIPTINFFEKLGFTREKFNPFFRPNFKFILNKDKFNLSRDKVLS